MLAGRISQSPREDCNYDHVLIGYGDCGTGGGLDRLLKDYPKAERLPGAHCYAFYAGLSEFDDMMEEELGSFFLTDYLVRHFKTLIIKGFGMDRYPNLKETYFEHYKRLIYMSQDPTDELIELAQSRQNKRQRVKLLSICSRKVAVSTSRMLARIRRIILCKPRNAYVI